MENPIYKLCCLAGIIFLGSCAHDGTKEMESREAFRLNYTVIGQQAETTTRANVPAVDGEQTIRSLYLLFFDHTDDGSGKFVAPYQVTGTLGMNESVPISFAGYDELKNDRSYNILAVANLDRVDYISNDPINWITANFTGHTEYYTVMNAMAYIQGAPNNNENDDTRRILPSEIIMSGTAVKKADVQEVSLELTRGVVRFDVKNGPNDKFDLVSASVWNAPVSAPVWTGDIYSIPDRVQRFYGLKQERKAGDDDPLPDFTGGLYSFENFVSGPLEDDRETTCVIIGIMPRDGAPSSFTRGKVTYHRVNIHPGDGGQNIKRNNVYKITVNNINNEGADSEYEAWSKGVNSLDIIVNNWNLDDNGMVLTDGRNTLVIPVKRVVLDPDGDQREYSVFTLGDGDPYISKSELSSGLRVDLVGNRLQVEADPLAPGQSERKGMVEIALNSLRGEINFIQSPDMEEYLTLNHTQLSSFPSLGVAPIPDGYIEVTSSGPWTAKIYNNGTSSNPGFAFNIAGSGGNPVTELTFESNLESNYIQIYTTGANPTSEPRYSFVQITLDSNPGINRSLVLIQRGLQQLKVEPEVSSVAFLPTGLPSPAIGAQYIDGDWIVFRVDPGADEHGVANPWEARLAGNSNFEVVYNYDPADKTKNYVKLKAKGSNYGGFLLSDILQIYHYGEANMVSVNVRQAPAELDLQLQGSSIVSVRGGTVEVRVDIDNSLKWSAGILNTTPGLAHGHGGYMLAPDGTTHLTGSQTITGRPTGESLKIGFPKLLTPNCYVTPEMTVTVTIDGTDLSGTVTIRQEQLTPKEISALHMYPGFRGYITRGMTDYNRYYVQTLYNLSVVGPNAPVYSPKSLSLPSPDPRWGANPSAIAGTVTHFNAQNIAEGSSSERSRRGELIESWRSAYEGILVINDDYPSGDGFTNGSLYQLLGYTRGSRGGNNSINLTQDQTHRNTKIFRYLAGGEGPFGKGVVINSFPTLYADDTRLVMGGYPSTAVPIMVDNGGGASIIVDPVNRVVFNGELQTFFSDGGNASTFNFSGTPSAEGHYFLANLVAFIHNVAMYGTHFTDHFLDETDTQPPYDYSK